MDRDYVKLIQSISEQKGQLFSIIKNLDCYNNRVYTLFITICLEVHMFGLPGITAAVLFGFPIFWIVYTIIFFVKSKDWPKDVETEEEGGTNNG